MLSFAYRPQFEFRIRVELFDADRKSFFAKKLLVTLPGLKFSDAYLSI